MIKYNKKLVKDYINGEDIDYEIDELENDPKFMLLVIKESKDKNFYNLCSDKVKKDFEIVKYLLDNFGNDKEFAKKISDYFFEHNEEESYNISIALRLKKIFVGEDEYLNYAIMVNLYMVTDEVIKELYLRDEEARGNFHIRDEFGKGFYSDSVNYSYDELLLNYIVEDKLDDIFCEFDLEDYLHKHYKSYENFEKYGENKFLIGLIGSYDEDLGNYVAVHLDLLKDIIKDLRIIKNNWKNYEYTTEKEKFEYIIEETRDYLEYDGWRLNHTAEEILYYLACKYNVQDKLEKYISISDFDKDFEEYLKDFSVEKRKMFNHIKKIFENGLNKNYQDPYILEEQKKVKRKAQLLRFEKKESN